MESWNVGGVEETAVDQVVNQSTRLFTSGTISLRSLDSLNRASNLNSMRNQVYSSNIQYILK